MTTKLSCIVHLEGVKKDGAEPFTKTRWDKCREVAREWLELDGNDQSIAAFFNTNGLITKDIEDTVDCGYGFHPTCYRRFTDKTRLIKAVKRCQKKAQLIESKKAASTVSPTTCRPSTSRTSSSPSSKTKSKGVSHSPPSPPLISPKKLRSHHGTVLPTTLSSELRKSVLPDICIICKKKTKYSKVKGTQKRDNLVQCETKAAGSLLEAAKQKKDESILIHIRDQDCVAIEVKYHRICYRNYCRFLFQKSPHDSAVNEPDQLYSDVLQKKLIDNQEILRMTKLTEMFNNIIKDKIGESASFIRTDRLKYRIKKDFPQLTFYSQPRKNLSELVYIESLPAESFMDTLQFSSTDESTGTDESDVDQQPQPIKVFDVNPKKTLFDASLIIKKSLADKPGMVCPWPPTSSDLNMKSALDIVPLELFNFMSWVTGSSEEPTLSEMVNVSDNTYPKILSICQDIVYLASGGRKQTPKALSLGLTTRHLTGSSQLLTILHKLGHCSSTSTIIGFETSLAELQLATQGSIPKGFGRSIPAILVWDNIDFGEETLSGKGTTHHTNGILIQNKVMTTETDKQRELSLPRGQRTLKAKPVTMFEYHLTKRHGPIDIRSDIEIDEKHFVANLKSANNLDLSFIILKYLTSSYDDHLPGWTGFNCEIDSTIFPKSAIHYMPVIEASPTDMTTVNTILIKSVSVADSFQLSNILLVFDQAIYAKAQQIRWKDPELSKRLIIRLGEFHTTMAFLAIIGKVYKDAGLQDILIESDVVAQGSINGVINGHHYNRSLRSHKLLYEALQRLRFSVFLDSLDENDIIPIQKEMTNLELAYGTKTLSEYLITEDYIILVDKFETFVSQKCKENPTFAFWSNYINLVQTVLVFIRATRQSDWTLHLSSLRCMLPWFFSYDRMNYARYAPAYWLEMMRLPISHPELDVNMFKDGNWTVHRQDNSPFSSIACDQAIEETCNRDSKTKGGIVGMTLNRGAVQRWILAQPERAAITRQCEEMSTMDKPHRKRKDLDRSRLKRDEESICALISTIDSMINPFDNPGELVSISSGIVAGDSITKDLLSSKEKGAQALDLFMQNRLIKKTEDFFAPIKSMKLKTFSDVSKTKTTKSVSGKDVTIKVDRKFFQRLLVIGQNRELDLKDILTYSLGPVSYPLANSVGSLAKTNKAALLVALENKSENIYKSTVDVNQLTCNQPSAIIIDGMAVIQSISNIPSTFGELADQIFVQIYHQAQHYKCIRLDFVCDRYPECSIKNPERVRRAASGTQKIQVYSKDQRTPKQWKKFLSSGENKETLIEFLFSVWRDIDGSAFNQDMDIFICHGPECHLLSIHNKTASVLPIKELETDHEEADTRLLLHAKHASAHCPIVIIKSPDTDVAILTIHFTCQFPSTKLYFLTGQKNKVRLIDIQALSTCLGPDVSLALVGLHSFSGCDSTSAFYGKGKKRILDLVMSSKKYIELMCKIGDTSDHKVVESLLSKTEVFVCHLYGLNNVQNVNEARHKLFCTKTALEQNMPPTSDALNQHLLRANYQACIHKRSLCQWMQMPSPNNNGWTVHNNILDIVWMTKDPVPKSLLDVVHCNCKTGCNSGRCVCFKGKVSCTDLCKCLTCKNVLSVETDEIDSHIELDDESDDEYILL